MSVEDEELCEETSLAKEGDTVTSRHAVHSSNNCFIAFLPMDLMAAAARHSYSLDESIFDAFPWPATSLDVLQLSSPVLLAAIQTKHKMEPDLLIGLHSTCTLLDGGTTAAA